MPSHVKPRKVIIHGHPTSVRLEPAAAKQLGPAPWWLLRRCGRLKENTNASPALCSSEFRQADRRGSAPSVCCWRIQKLGCVRSCDVDVATGCAGYRVDVRSD